MSSGTECPVGQNVRWDRMSGIFLPASDRKSGGTECPVGQNVRWDRMSGGTECPVGQNVRWFPPRVHVSSHVSSHVSITMSHSQNVKDVPFVLDFDLLDQF